MLAVNMRAPATTPLSLTSRAVTSTTAFGDGSNVIWKLRIASSSRYSAVSCSSGRLTALS